MRKYLLLLTTVAIINYGEANAFADTGIIASRTNDGGRPLYFVDNKETDYAIIKKLDVKSVENIEYQKAPDAVKAYGIRGRFGAVKITLRKMPLVLPKNSLYSSTFYIMQDTGHNVMQTIRFSNNLDTMLNAILTEYPNAEVLTDYLGYRGSDDVFKPLNEVSAAFNLIYMKNHMDSISLPFAEAVFYCSKRFQSGKIYFSGSNFANVISCDATDISCVQQNFARCAIGCIITFDLCRYRNQNNAYDYVSRQIKL